MKENIICVRMCVYNKIPYTDILYVRTSVSLLIFNFGFEKNDKKNIPRLKCSFKSDTHFFSRFPAPVSRNPFAKGLLSIFS